MSVILCAIRGGPECLPSIAQAITLAQETSLPVHFLYIVNRDLLSSANSTQAHAISGQIRQMGKSVLRTALDLASRQGVTAQGVIRQGNVGDEIASLCRDLEADYLVIGRPQPHEERNVFSEALLAQFIERIEKQTEAKVVPSIWRWQVNGIRE
jgi:nucleotide-binding universal stress UspA family protein